MHTSLTAVGVEIGLLDGADDGPAVGEPEGLEEGDELGDFDGLLEGPTLGVLVGMRVGVDVGVYRQDKADRESCTKWVSFKVSSYIYRQTTQTNILHYLSHYSLRSGLMLVCSWASSVSWKRVERQCTKLNE